MKQNVVAGPLSPELVLVLPDDERQAVRDALSEPHYRRSPTPQPTGAPEAKPLSGLPLIKAAAVYTTLRIATAVPHQALTVLPVIALLTVLALLR